MKGFFVSLLFCLCVGDCFATSVVVKYIVSETQSIVQSIESGISIFIECLHGLIFHMG